MADLYLQTYQYKYFNSFTFFGYTYEFQFYYITEPIFSNDEIVSWSFKPCVDWVVYDEQVNSGYITDIYGNPLSFIYTTDEIKDGMFYNSPLLDCEIIWSSNGYSMNFYFYDYVNEFGIDSRDFSFLNYDISQFMSSEIISAPFSSEDKDIYLQDVADELIIQNENLVIEIENITSSIGATGSTFELFADAFKPVFDTLNIQIAPNITVGMILTIPIVAGVLSFILKESVK